MPPVVGIVARARQIAERVHRIEERIQAAVADGDIKAPEQRAIDRETVRALAQAQGLVARQGDSTVDALEHLKKLGESGRLELRASSIVTELVDARKEMVRDARHDANTNPFRRLGKGFRSPFPGVRTKDFSFEGKNAHLVVVDLANPKVRVETNRRDERGRSPMQHARAHGAEIAINGDFFSAGFRPSGLAMTGDKTWKDTKGVSWEGALAWKGQHVDFVPQSSGVEPWATNAVSARPVILENGRVRRDFSGDPSKALPSRRTGVGLSRDGRLLYLVAVSSPIGAKDLGRLLRRQGAWEAMTMDAGGSAQMYQRNRGLVQRSSDAGGQRAVANSILIQAG